MDDKMRFEKFKYAHDNFCGNTSCYICPLNIQVMHDATLKDLCDLIIEADYKDELFKGIENIEVKVPDNFKVDMSEEKKEENDAYFESMMRLGF